jgi:transcriptional regulator GlxA family with amidase domain
LIGLGKAPAQSNDARPGDLRGRRNRERRRMARRAIAQPAENRRLDRLFRRHIGASPLQVAQTVRVQRAKRLLDQTTLPMTEIASRAGFASLRRFNTMFGKVYKQPPSVIRKKKGPANRALLRS